MATTRRKDARGDFHRKGVDVVADGIRHVVEFRKQIFKRKKRKVPVKEMNEWTDYKAAHGLKPGHPSSARWVWFALAVATLAFAAVICWWLATIGARP